MRLDSALRYIYVVNMVLAALMPFVPDRLSPLTIGFSLSFGMLLFLWLRKMTSSRKFSLNRPGITLICFYLSVLLSAPVALANDISWGAWSRGAVPFIFLSVYFFITPITTERNAAFILNTLHLAAVFWLVKIMVIAFLAIEQILSGVITRLTYLTGDASLPYSVVGLALSLFNPDPRAVKSRFPLTVIFLLVIALAGHRSQVMIATVILLVYFYRQQLWKKIALVSFLLVAGITVWFTVEQTPHYQQFVMRFLALNGELSSSRVMEIRYALQRFAESPVIGNGLGYPVPAEIHFGGNLENVRNNSDIKPFRYIHNLFGYLLMDLGVLGCVSYIWFVVGALWKGWCGERGSKGSVQIKFSAAISLISLLTFFMAEPSFRHIQSNLIVAASVALLWHSSKDLQSKSDAIGGGV